MRRSPRLPRRRLAGAQTSSPSPHHVAAQGTRHRADDSPGQERSTPPYPTSWSAATMPRRFPSGWIELVRRRFRRDGRRRNRRSGSWRGRPLAALGRRRPPGRRSRIHWCIGDGAPAGNLVIFSATPRWPPRRSSSRREPDAPLGTSSTLPPLRRLGGGRCRGADAPPLEMSPVDVRFDVTSATSTRSGTTGNGRSRSRGFLRKSEAASDGRTGIHFHRQQLCPGRRRTRAVFEEMIRLG